MFILYFLIFALFAKKNYSNKGETLCICKNLGDKKKLYNVCLKPRTMKNITIQ